MNPLNIMTPEQYQKAWDEAAASAKDILDDLFAGRLIASNNEITLLSRSGDSAQLYGNADMVAHHLARFIEAEVQKRLAASEERAEKMRNLKFYSDRLQEQREEDSCK